MSTHRQFLSSAAILALTAVFGHAQSIAPAHSGTVHYFEGDVSVDGVKLVSQVARFTEMKEQSVLQTGLGRAEILLTPGVLLRVGENTSVKMLDNRLLSTRVEFLSGIAMLESVEGDASIKDPAVTIIYKDFQAQPVKFGLFEMKSEPSQVRVFKGEAKITGNGTAVVVKDGNLLDLTGSMATAKFDAKEGDDLYLWSRDRSAYLSAGNMSSARTLAASGYGSSYGYTGMGFAGTGMGTNGMSMAGLGMNGMGMGWNPAMWSGFSGGWYYNSYLDMYSYLPFSGVMYSPFGYGFYTPMTVAYVYTPGYYWQGAGGSRTGTTLGVPLSSLPASGSLQLPRLGATASLRPSVPSPGTATSSLLARTSSGAAPSLVPAGLASSTSSSASVSAPRAATASARVSGGKR